MRRLSYSEAISLLILLIQDIDMNIIPKLSLNKHPKDCQNLSLVYALNVKVSNDESCITNEETLQRNDTIHNFLNSHFTSGYKIVGIIPCNTELVIIAIGINDTAKAHIFRYDENDSMIVAYGDENHYLAYHNGKIKGTFTYNVEGSLIIAVAEYDGDEEKIPLRTINLGNKDDDSVRDDTNLINEKLSVAPMVFIPTISDYQYIAGSAYKGWYYLFIRYKINSVDYTQWYSFSYPIYIDSLEEFQIIKYCYNREIKLNTGGVWEIVAPEYSKDGYAVGCSDSFSNTSDIAKETFKVSFVIINLNKYEKYQIGLVCASKSYTKGFRTADINISDLTSTMVVETYTHNHNALIEHSVEDFTIDNYNYYDVHNIVNYKNRLYISNYKENNLNDDTIAKSGIIDNIDVTFSRGTIADKGLVHDFPIMNREGNHTNQYNTVNIDRLYLYDYFNVPQGTKVTVTASSGGSSGGTAADYYIGGDSPGRYPSYIAIYGTDGTKYTGDVKIIINPNAPNYTIENIVTTDYGITGSMVYHNTNKSFENRKLNSTLIPGEVYNFFIHFVDKYGHATNGFRINNKYKWVTADDPNTEVIPVPIVLASGTYYAAAPIDANIFDGGSINNNLSFYESYSKNGNIITLTGKTTSSGVINGFKEIYSSFADNKYADTKWYQIALPFNLDYFVPYINNNGDRLFRVPIHSSSPDAHVYYHPNFSNIKIPDGYIGCFISYEKFEPTKRVVGMLTRSDFRSQSAVRGDILVTANCFKSSKMYLYSGYFDISDSIKLDYNMMNIMGMNVFKRTDIPEYDSFQRNNFYNFMHDFNKPQITADCNDVFAIYAVPNYKLAVGDSANDGRIGLGTALEMDDSYALFTNKDPDGSNEAIRLYKVALYNCTRDLYMSNNKTLIRMTDVRYSIGSNISTGYINEGLNGHWSIEGVLVYENPGLSINDADNIARRIEDNTLYYPTSVDGSAAHTWQNDTPFAAYVQYPVCSDVFLESKSFKNGPKGMVYFVHHDEKDSNNNRFAVGSMVTPANSIDLFENRQGSFDDFCPKTYTNYREDLVSIDKFDKTVRRSNVIQDESRLNAWRTFPVEAYKNITENKGNITNLVGIGTMLLVHTQHSLFAFDTNNTLEANNKDIQLTQPDVFEVNYKEVFTSDLGYAGLQDDKAYIVDQFGYIFYNNDFHRFYQFDNGQLATIDEDIIQWLDITKPTKVRFANDKTNNRLLIKCNLNPSGSLVLSYNYNVKNFISIHSYSFTEGYNTKYNLYCKVGNVLHQFSSTQDYGGSELEDGSFSNANSVISVVINEQYLDIKYLDYITYKLGKYYRVDNISQAHLPVGKQYTPYSGDALKVYNDQVNTGELYINIDTESAKNVFGNYKKPYWEFGRWNFSYLRNNIANYSSYGDGYEMSRIFGNYFIVNFSFNNKDRVLIEFEELGYGLSK